MASQVRAAVLLREPAHDRGRRGVRHTCTMSMRIANSQRLISRWTGRWPGLAVLVVQAWGQQRRLPSVPNARSMICKICAVFAKGRFLTETAVNSRVQDPRYRRYLGIASQLLDALGHWNCLRQGKQRAFRSAIDCKSCRAIRYIWAIEVPACFERCASKVMANNRVRFIVGIGTGPYVSWRDCVRCTYDHFSTLSQ